MMQSVSTPRGLRGLAVGLLAVFVIAAGVQADPGQLLPSDGAIHVSRLPAGEPGSAGAFTLEWTQTDWAEGPGQALWEDPSAYNSSFKVDTMSNPGSMQLSYITEAPYTKEATNPVVGVGGAGSWDETNIVGFPMQNGDGGYELLYNGSDASGTPVRAIGYAST